MTIQQLIERLNEFPKDTRIMIDGYEGGYEDLEIIRESKVALNVHENDSPIYGNHDDCDESEKPHKVIDVLIFRRCTGF